MFINMSPDDDNLSLNIRNSATHYAEPCVDFGPGCFASIVTPTLNTLNQTRFTFIGHAGKTYGKDSDTPQSFFDKLEKYGFPFAQCQEIDLIGCELGLIKDTQNLSFAYQLAELIHAKYSHIKVRAPTSLVTNAPLENMFVYVYSTGEIHISGMDQKQFEQYQIDVKNNLPTSTTSHAATDNTSLKIRNYFIKKHSEIFYPTHFSREALDRHPSFFITTKIKKLNANQIAALAEVNNRIDELKKTNIAGKYNPVIASLEQLSKDIKDNFGSLAAVLALALCDEGLFENIAQIKRLKKIKDGNTHPPPLRRESDKFKQTQLLEEAASLGLATECKQLMHDKAEVTLVFAEKMETKDKKIAEDARAIYYSKAGERFNRTRAHIAVFDKKYDEIDPIKKYAGQQALMQADSGGWTPAMIALAQNDEKMLGVLERAGVPIKKELVKCFSSDKSTLAHAVVVAGNTDAITLLHKWVGIDIFHQTDKWGFTPSFNGIRLGKFAAFQALLKLKIPINTPKDSQVARALVYHVDTDLIAKSEADECLNALVAHKADFTAEDSKGVSIVSDAIRSKKWGIVGCMLMHIPASYPFSAQDLILLFRHKVEILASLKAYLTSPKLTQNEKQVYFNSILNTANFLGGILLESHKKPRDHRFFQPTEESFFKWAEVQKLITPLPSQSLFVKRDQYALLP